MRLYKKVSKLIEDWQPKKKYFSEDKYKNDLRDYLNKELNKLKKGLPSKTKEIKSREKAEECDIIIDREIGIELKKTKSKKIEKVKIDRLFDEITKKRNEHKKGIIIVLVGKTTFETRNYLKKKIKKYARLTRIISPLDQFRKTTYNVKFIDKSYE